MNPNDKVNHFPNSLAAASRDMTSSPNPQHSPRPQLIVQHQHCQTQATPNSHHLVHQMSSMQLQHTLVTPGSLPYLTGTSSPASEMSHHQGPMATRGMLTPSLMPQLIDMPLVLGRDAAMSVHPPRIPHSWQQQQQQFNPPKLESFQSVGLEPSHSSSVTQQPSQQGY